jgi:hypothetical protein
LGKRYAERVLEEYKKFIYLGSISICPVTPSDEVDQAWHLHMLYTRDYWKDLCEKILGREFHHGPTRGGNSENEKFLDLYEKTLSLYRENFGEPPIDIWPISSKRFANTDFKRVDFRRNWVIPTGDIRAICKVLTIELKKRIRRIWKF